MVVVLPWAPAMAIPWLKRMSSASISARRTSGIRPARAALTSALSSPTALLTTTTSAPRMLAAACPIATVIPSLASLSVVRLAERSEPLTA